MGHLVMNLQFHRASQCLLGARRIPFPRPIASLPVGHSGSANIWTSQYGVSSKSSYGGEIREWRRPYSARPARDTAKTHSRDNYYDYRSYFGESNTRTTTFLGLVWSVIGTISVANQLSTKAEKSEEDDETVEEPDDNTLALSATVLVRLRHFLSSHEFRSCVVDTFRKYEDPERPGRLQADQLQPALEEIHSTLFPILCREVLQKQPGPMGESRVLRDTKFSEQELKEWKQQAGLQSEREFYFTQVEYLARNVAFTAVIVYQIIEQSQQYIIQDLKPLITIVALTFVSGLAYMIYRKRQPPRPPPLTKSTRDKLRSLYKEND